MSIDARVTTVPSAGGMGWPPSTTYALAADIPSSDGAAGVLVRLPDGRLVTITVAAVAEGVEDTVPADIAGRLAERTPVTSDHMRALGVDAGLQAMATQGGED
jgi:hypothetical protein